MLEAHCDNPAEVLDRQAVQIQGSGPNHQEVLAGQVDCESQSGLVAENPRVVPVETGSWVGSRLAEGRAGRLEDLEAARH